MKSYTFFSTLDYFSKRKNKKKSKLGKDQKKKISHFKIGKK